MKKRPCEFSEKAVVRAHEKVLAEVITGYAVDYSNEERRKVWQDMLSKHIASHDTWTLETFEANYKLGVLVGMTAGACVGFAIPVAGRIIGKMLR